MFFNRQSALIFTSITVCIPPFKFIHKYLFPKISETSKSGQGATYIDDKISYNKTYLTLKLEKSFELEFDLKL